jgi:hypothetical protein
MAGIRIPGFREGTALGSDFRVSGRGREERWVPKLAMDCVHSEA